MGIWFVNSGFAGLCARLVGGCCGWVLGVGWRWVSFLSLECG